MGRSPAARARAKAASPPRRSRQGLSQGRSREDHRPLPQDPRAPPGAEAPAEDPGQVVATTLVPHAPWGRCTPGGYPSNHALRIQPKFRISPPKAKGSRGARDRYWAVPESGSGAVRGEVEAAGLPRMQGSHFWGPPDVFGYFPQASRIRDVGAARRTGKKSRRPDCLSKSRGVCSTRSGLGRRPVAPVAC
jgi:hypothetical protein